MFYCKLQYSALPKKKSSKRKIDYRVTYYIGMAIRILNKPDTSRIKV